MSNNFTLKAIITAVDKLSPVLAKQSRAIRSWSKQFKQAGDGAVPMALGLGAALAIPARAFMQAEDAATQLQNTLMTSDGVATGFKELTVIATELGSKLPGTTADFLQMASTMKALGVSTDSLTGGALSAAANLAVVAKPLGVTYDQAAESMGKLGKAFGISGKEMVPFADTLQRALHMGGDLEQMQYAMSRIAGSLKMLGIQGLGAANEMVPLVSLLAQAGLQGEAIGTGIQNMIDNLAGEGKYKGVKSLVNMLEKIHKLSPEKQFEALGKLFDKQAITKASIIGAGGYQQLLKDMERQASLDQRIANSLKTLSNIWDAASGTFVNAMVAFAESYAPELKDLAQSINDISSKLLDWATANKPIIRMAIVMAGTFVGLKLAAYGLGAALAIVAGAMNPWVLAMYAASIAIPLLIANWDTLTARFSSGWNNTMNAISSAWHNVVGGIQLGIGALNSAFPSLGEILTSTFGGAIKTVMAWWDALVGKVSAGIEMVAGFVKSMGGANVGSMTLPGQAIQRKPIVSNHGFKGSLDINHQNAPAGFRASPVQSKGPVRVNQNVGYNFMVTGH